MIGIYKITNKINGKCYIGQSVDIKRRWKGHKKDAFWKNGPDYEYPLYRSIRKYGIDNFSFDVVEECSQEELNEKEIYYIALYQSNNRDYGYNQNDGGHLSTHTCKLTHEEVDQIIHRLRTTFDNAETICKDFDISATTIRDINRGDKYHRENEIYPIRPKLHTIQNNQTQHLSHCSVCDKEISCGARMCKICYRKSTRKSDRPKPLDLAKMIKELGFTKTGKRFGVDGNTIKSWCKDYEIPYKLKEIIIWYDNKMGIVNDPKPVKKKINEIVRPVKQIDKTTGEILAIFDCQADALRYLGKSTNENHISQVCRGLRKSAYGYFWQYADQDIE